MKDTNNQGKSFQERLAEAEERRKNATISDIIAAKRREADSIEASARGSFKAGEDWDERPFTESDLESALDLAETKRKEADRLEAALRRDCASIERIVRDAILGYGEMFSTAPNDESEAELKARAETANIWLERHGFTREEITWTKEEASEL